MFIDWHKPKGLIPTVQWGEFINNGTIGMIIVAIIIDILCVVKDTLSSKTATARAICTVWFLFSKSLIWIMNYCHTFSKTGATYAKCA